MEYYKIVVYLYTFILAMCIGSFLNVIAYRTVSKESFVKGRSHCPRCGHQLGIFDLVPIFSWLFLGGKCRYCKEKISPRYIFTELLSGLCGVICVWRFSLSLQAALVFFVFSILLIISLIDFETMTIPNGLNLCLIIPALAAIVIFPDVDIISRLIGFFAVSVPMLLLTLLIADAFGGGDIKLIAVCGFMLGWQNLLVATFIGLVTGGIYAVWQLMHKTRGHMAFGPYLCIGIFTALCFGGDIISAYLGAFGLL